jgi:hypothetical protein
MGPVRLLAVLALVAACRRPAPAEPRVPADDAAPRPSPPAAVDPVLARATASLEAGDVPGARRVLEAQRWYAKDKARAALLLCGCLLVQGDHAAAMDALRAYLEKTTGPGGRREALATRLLRHHASGGGLRAGDAEAACYFGLYALKALGEPEAAKDDLAWAAREAPPPERALARAALGDGCGS